MTWYTNGHNYVHFLFNLSIIVWTKSISYDCDRWVCRRKGSITALPDSKIHATLLQRPGRSSSRNAGIRNHDAGMQIPHNTFKTSTSHGLKRSHVIYEIAKILYFTHYNTLILWLCRLCWKLLFVVMPITKVWTKSWAGLWLMNRSIVRNCAVWRRCWSAKTRRSHYVARIISLLRCSDISIWANVGLPSTYIHVRKVMSWK